jgi:GTP-binding protein Era
VRFFAAEYLREAAFELLQDELPYAFAVEIQEFRESEDPVLVRANLFVETRSQKQIVIGAGGRMIREIGKHARERLERLIGRPVYLETWVQVLPKWRRDPVQLRRLGF